MTENEVRRYSLFESLKRALLMGTIIELIFKAGHKTSEFWLTLLAMLLPVIDHFVNPVLASHDPSIFVWGLLAAAYTFSRGWIKAHAAKEVSGGAARVTSGGNIEQVHSGPGLAAQEAAHAQLSSAPGGMDLTKLSRGL